MQKARDDHDIVASLLVIVSDVPRIGSAFLRIAGDDPKKVEALLHIVADVNENAPDVNEKACDVNEKAPDVNEKASDVNEKARDDDGIVSSLLVIVAALLDTQK